MSLLKGVALVTGAAGGIGRGIALRLAKDGFDVAVHDLPGLPALADVKKEIESNGRRAHLVEGDVSQEQSVRDMVKSVVGTLGSLDVMVANAGIATVHSILETSVEEYERIQAVNARGVFLCYKHAAEQMIAQGRGGRLIAASSIWGKRGFGGAFGYSTSKWAVRGMTQSAAELLGKYNITANAYAPGGIDTKMLSVQVDPATGKLHSPFGLDIQGMVDNSPISRMGQPVDVAHVVSFLASENGSFITGQTISVNGGTHFD